MESLKSKLTLSCNKAIIEEAKKYAELNDDSISNIVSEFLESYISMNKHKTAQDNTLKEKLKIAKKYSGAFDFGPSKNYRSEYYESQSKPKSKK